MQNEAIQKRLRRPRACASRACRGALAYVELSKPASVALLVFTGLASFLVAGGRVLAWPLLVVLLAGTAGSAGANAVTCYIDRDIDAVMVRTRRRPLPSGSVRPAERALCFGLALALIALALSATLGSLAFGLMLIGLLDNVVVYSLLTKRRSRWNVLWGGLSGGIPVAFGWVAATGRLSASAVLMSALVVLWIPTHIWNLVIYYSEDYQRVRVPMLPVVIGLSKATRCLASTAVLLYAGSLALCAVEGFGWVYLAVAAPAGLALVLGNIHLARRPSRPAAWRLFKLSSPYLLLLFAAMVLDMLL